MFSDILYICDHESKTYNLKVTNRYCPIRQNYAYIIRLFAVIQDIRIF